MSKEVLQGTLDLMVLRTLESMGPQHGFGLAKRILQMSEGILDLNQGTLYPAVLRLEQRGWIKSRWGISDNNRKAKFYELRAHGRLDAALPGETGGQMIRRLFALFRSHRLDAELDEELRYHLESLES